MSLRKNSMHNSPNKADVRRRNFLSTGILGGLTFALTPGLETAFAHPEDTATPDMLPTPADSLTLYLLLLDRLKSNILNPYFDLLNCISGEVISRHAQLLKDVAELERMVPALRTRPETSNLRSVSGIGYASASLMETLSAERVVLTNAAFNLASFDPESLRKTATALELQRGSLTLLPRAAALLRKILAEIHDLQQPSEGLGKTTEIIMELNSDLDGEGGKMTAIRQKLITAISLLVSAEITSGTTSTAGQTTAKEKVKEAIADLEGLDSYVPPKSLTAYAGSSRSNRCPEARARTTVAAVPTQSLRDLLAGTVAWIESGGQISQSSRGEVQFIKTSGRASVSPPLFGRWYAVRQALYDNLPPASNGRTFMCLSLIAPILIGYEQTRRVEMIYQQLANLMPGGTLDQNVTKRRSAAESLAKL